MGAELLSYRLVNIMDASMNSSNSSSFSASSSSTVRPTVPSAAASTSPKSPATTRKNLESIIFIDTVDKLRQILPELRRHRIWAIDLEGVDLGATGEICIIQISTGRYSPVILLDVHTLGTHTFTTEYSPSSTDQTLSDDNNTSSTADTKSSTSSSLSFVTVNDASSISSSLSVSVTTTTTVGYNLKQLLEDTHIIKFLWDVRADTNALFGIFGVTIKSAVDLQLMELAYRVTRNKFSERICGLGFIIDRTYHAKLSPDERLHISTIKKESLSLFTPESGGSYNVWKERPLHPVLLEYATDSRLFFSLYESFTEQWGEKLFLYIGPIVDEATERRIQEAMDLDTYSKMDRDKRVMADPVMLLQIKNVLRDHFPRRQQNQHHHHHRHPHNK